MIGFRRDATRGLAGLGVRGAEDEAESGTESGRTSSAGVWEGDSTETGGAKDERYERESRVEGEACRMERMKSCG
jgi:hypothetical protein